MTRTDSPYYDSAEGEQITRKRALVELRRHGVEDAEEFDRDMGGPRESYDAQAVLSWLGY